MSKLDEILAGEFVFETILALGVVATGVVQGLRSLSQAPPEKGLAASFISVAVFLGVVLLFRARVRNNKARKDANPDSLDSVLYTLHALLAEFSKIADRNGLRICVFVPGRTDGEAHQICNYVGLGEGSGSGRDMSCRCGVVGRAFRSGQAEYAQLPRHTNLVDYLVQTHSFDRSEAVSMRQDAASWAAIPVGTPGHIVAVIFLDSDARDFFGKGNSQKRKILEYATIGVAKFIARN